MRLPATSPIRRGTSPIFERSSAARSSSTRSRSGAARTESRSSTPAPRFSVDSISRFSWGSTRKSGRSAPTETSSILSGCSASSDSPRIAICSRRNDNGFSAFWASRRSTWPSSGTSSRTRFRPCPRRFWKMSSPCYSIETPLKAPLGDVVVSRAEALRRGLLSVSEVGPRRPGLVDGPLGVAEPISPTAFELYLRCPFKYYSRYLLGVEEEEEVEEQLSPLERGRILHEVLQQGFAEWDRGSTSPRRNRA